MTILFAQNLRFNIDLNTHVYSKIPSITINLITYKTIEYFFIIFHGSVNIKYYFFYILVIMKLYKIK